VLKVNYDAIIKAKDELSTEVQTLKEQQRQEEQKIYRENDNKKSLEELAVKKTGLVQKVINKATKKAFDCFVTISEGGDC
jgi:phosphopantothenate synthetase